MILLKKLKIFNSKNTSDKRSIYFVNQRIEISESFRKSIEIKIENAKLTLRCPFRTSDEKLLNFLNKKKNWINNKLNIQLKNIDLIYNRKRKDIYLYLGVEKKLKLEHSYHHSIINFKTNIIYKDASFFQKQIRKNLINWYKLSAKNFLSARIKKISSKFGIFFNEVVIKEYKSKWGLCYFEKKKICLNWKLIMAPISVIDYVIIHELCHLIEPNHSKSFWQEIYKLKKDYKNDILWLKKNGTFLSV